MQVLNREKFYRPFVTLVKELEFSYFLFKMTSLPILHSKNFGLSLIGLGFKHFFPLRFILIVVFPFRTGKRRTCFQGKN